MFNAAEDVEKVVFAELTPIWNYYEISNTYLRFNVFIMHSFV
jgi:hypothetical protein